MSKYRIQVEFSHQIVSTLCNDSFQRLRWEIFIPHNSGKPNRGFAQ
jgi:hypothetical protein